MDFFFPKKPSTANVAGLALTRDEAQILVGICQTLERSLVKQTAEIEVFPNMTRDHSHHAIQAIQERHNRVSNHLSDLIYRVSASSEPWLQELSDAKRTMELKIRMCNRASRPFAMGWKEAAKMYWPFVLETYTLLFDLIASLKQELEDALKSGGAWLEEVKKMMRRSSVKSVLSRRSTPKTSSEGKSVKFNKAVQGRFFVQDRAIFGTDGVENAQGQPKRKEFTVALANDKKQTAKKLKHRATQSPSLTPRRVRAGDAPDGQAFLKSVDAANKELVRVAL